VAAACALALGLAAPVAAQTLFVEGVVSPAWRERGASREPLAPGMALAGQDAVITGAGARALLRLADGSAVKLGENARLGVETLFDRKDAQGRLIGASLEVARGAFRFTTGLFAASSAGREVTIRVSAVTAGIRGTDVWGKSEPERDIVCLIEGRVAVEHAGRQFVMQEPLSFFIAPRIGEPAPVAQVPREQLEAWARETEIAAGDGGIRREGAYDVEVLATRDADTARQTLAKLNDAGFPAVRESTRDGYGDEEHRIRIAGFASAADARAAAQRLQTMGYKRARAR
jgi:hypothetical protein